jgi:hypothetical protein
MTPTRKQKAFKSGGHVEYETRQIVSAKIIGFRWVGFPDGTGIWKYKLSNGTEHVATGLTKISRE